MAACNSKLVSLFSLLLVTWIQSTNGKYGSILIDGEPLDMEWMQKPGLFEIWFQNGFYPAAVQVDGLPISYPEAEVGEKAVLKVQSPDTNVLLINDNKYVYKHQVKISLKGVAISDILLNGKAPTYLKTGEPVPEARYGSILIDGEPLDMEHTLILTNDQVVMMLCVLIGLLLTNLVCLSYYNCMHKTRVHISKI